MACCGTKAHHHLYSLRGLGFKLPDSLHIQGAKGGAGGLADDLLSTSSIVGSVAIIPSEIRAVETICKFRKNSFLHTHPIFSNLWRIRCVAVLKDRYSWGYLIKQCE